MIRRAFGLLSALLATALFVSTALAAPGERESSFSADIRPRLGQH